MADKRFGNGDFLKTISVILGIVAVVGTAFSVFSNTRTTVAYNKDDLHEHKTLASKAFEELKDDIKELDKCKVDKELFITTTEGIYRQQEMILDSVKAVHKSVESIERKMP